MKQLTLDITPASPPSFDNFVAGRNAEALHLLRAVVAGDSSERFVYLWGAPGSGRSHLLRAAVSQYEARDEPARYIESRAMPPDNDALAQPTCVAIDDVDALDARGESILFNTYNAMHAGRGVLITAGPAAPAQLRLRADVITRLASGLVYQLHALTDDDKAQALSRHARARGLRVPAEVIAYLLRHGRRDLPSLLATLDALDRYSLEAKRPITLPLLRELAAGDSAVAG